jgi:cytidylate kinase
MDNIIITINREGGSRGGQIGRELGKKLGLKVYNRALLDSVADKYNLTKDDIERIKAKKVSFWDDFCQFYTQFGAVTKDFMADNTKVTSRQLYYAEAEIMRNLASQESCIIIGRSAFNIFKNNPNVIKIFITADMDVRVKNVSERYGLDEKTALEQIKSVDTARENFTKTFAEVSRYNLRNYDFTINVSDYTIEEAAALLEEIVRNKIKKHSL